MSRVSLVDAQVEALETPAEEWVSEILEEVQAQLGFLPTVFRAYANSPALLAELWERYQRVMLTGGLSRTLKEGIALMVAADEHSDYGISLHSSELQKAGVDPKEVLRIRTNPDHAHFDRKDHALLEVARCGNSAPFDHGDRVVAHAQDSGASDADIVEALAVAGLAAEISHVSTILDIPSDTRV